MPSRSEIKEKYFKTNIPGLDSLFQYGIPVGKAVLIEGSPGTGKTIFCLQLAYNMCKQGKRVLYMSFEESEKSLREHMKDFGWNSTEIEEIGLFRIKRFSAIDIARSVEALLSEAKKELLIATEAIIFPRDFDPEVVLIDSLTSISSAFSGEVYRFRIYMEQLFRYLESKNITSFLIKENPMPTHIGIVSMSDPHGTISFLADGIICFYNVVYPGGKRGNTMEILKMRGASFKKITVKTEITSQGMVIYPNQVLKGEYVLT